jgi:delta(3,5)-delta(2,4)-dienoyl-CoA isomerase
MLVTSPAPYVAHVQINRPEKLNSFSQPVWLEFGRVFDQLSGDAEVRAVVLSGAGERAFTTGLDVKAASEDSILSAKTADPARKAKLMRSHIEEFQGSVGALEKCEKRKLRRDTRARLCLILLLEKKETKADIRGPL